ncbi:hypothetical protein BpHYR1_052119 [Brachionus plicatilis]|uniref:Uncharacterized protein n=1 Tax=Brachionus plicatilis TaxID=10195 RepID=A0A3M7RX39_BRAPC|nr:hypothetical protein BpHYR1_052119 [Brachionus plicatilis]
MILKTVKLFLYYKTYPNFRSNSDQFSSFAKDNLGSVGQQATVLWMVDDGQLLTSFVIYIILNLFVFTSNIDWRRKILGVFHYFCSSSLVHCQIPIFFCRIRNRIKC